MVPIELGLEPKTLSKLIKTGSLRATIAPSDHTSLSR